MENAAKYQDFARKRPLLAWARFRAAGSLFLKDPADNFILFAVLVLLGTVLLVAFMWFEWRAEHEVLAQFLVRQP